MQPPCTTSKKSWPPDYVSVWAWRQDQFWRLRDSPSLVMGARIYYADRPVEFINHWCDTYDPRNAGSDTPARMPFILFPRQADMVRFLHECVRDEEGGLIEKCRDMGATWVCSAFSVWLWLFWAGASVGWGSRKEQLVDKLGDPDSIFEKIRMVIRGLPSFFYPVGWNELDHMSYMRIINPQTGATITGEAGDNIGRGGRKLIYFKDESAHYERPEKIEAALSDNTRVPIDISSVNGLGNVFHRKRESGEEWTPKHKIPKGTTRVFIMDWRDHPMKTKKWYDTRRERSESEGLAHIFAQEVDRNYSAAVDGVIIPALWVKSAIDAHKTLKFDKGGSRFAGLDVADEGGDKNALARRCGVLLELSEAWGEGDTGQTTRRAVTHCEGCGEVSLQYDSIGVGAGVKAEANRLKDEGLLPKGLSFSPWSASASPLDPDEHVEPGDEETPLNRDFYDNLKAQGWWQLRRRFEKTHRAITEGIKYHQDELISLPSSLPHLRQLEKELSQPVATRRTGSMKLTVLKTPPGTRSPNMADAVMMAYWPIAASYNFWNM